MRRRRSRQGLLRQRPAPSIAAPSVRRDYRPALSATTKRRQGAIVCADWPGFGKISRDNYCSASDLDDRLDLGGMVVLFFTAFSAGTPVSNEFILRDDDQPAPLAPQAFIAPLAKHLLGRAGVSAVFGQVDRTGNTLLSGARSRRSRLSKKRSRRSSRASL